MDIVVKGRNVEVPDHYRMHVAGKLARLERYDTKVIRYDVELLHERNRRQSKNCQRVEITGKGGGAVVRAEACAADFYAALDTAINKIENRLRRAHDRRRVHYGRHNPRSVAEATAPLAVVQSVALQANGHGDAQAAVLTEREAAWQQGGAPDASSDLDRSDLDQSELDQSELDQSELDQSELDQSDDADAPQQRWNDDAEDEHLPGRIVREKEHPAEPMTVDQALYQMELVGHDFYLFADADSGRPSVVYRRKGFDYGVIRLAR